MEDQIDEPRCLACGSVLPALLVQTGSVRCHDCRDDGAPLKPELVEPTDRETEAA